MRHENNNDYGQHVTECSLYQTNNAYWQNENFKTKTLVNPEEFSNRPTFNFRGV